MGLLEKAGKIQTNEKTNEGPIPVVMEAVVEPKPIATKKATRKKKEKAPKKVRTPKAKELGFLKNYLKVLKMLQEVRKLPEDL